MKEIYEKFSPKFISMNLLKRDRFLIENVTYDFWNLFIVIDGSFSLGNDNTIVRAGDIVLFAPKKSFVRKVIEPLTFLSIHFEWEAFSQEAKEYEISLPFGRISFKDDRRIISTARLMQSANSDTLRNHYLKDVWNQFCIESYKIDTVTSNSTVNKALDILASCELDSINISELSEKLCISHAHLINLFKHTVGMTPIEYVSSLRIQKAKSLLLETEYGIQKISELCGFANLYYFSAAFKKATGSSPSLFRKIYRA